MTSRDITEALKQFLKLKVNAVLETHPLCFISPFQLLPHPGHELLQVQILSPNDLVEVRRTSGLIWTQKFELRTFR